MSLALVLQGQWSFSIQAIRLQVFLCACMFQRSSTHIRIFMHVCACMHVYVCYTHAQAICTWTTYMHIRMHANMYIYIYIYIYIKVCTHTHTHTHKPRSLSWSRSRSRDIYFRNASWRNLNSQSQLTYGKVLGLSTSASVSYQWPAFFPKLSICI